MAKDKLSRESVIFDGLVMYHMATLANKLEALCEMQALLHHDELTEAVGKMRDDVIQGIKEIKKDG